MARKPLIDPNSLNQGGSTPLSTISRIVQRDRETSGRGNPPEEAPETAPMAQGEPVSQLTGEPDHSLTAAPVDQTTEEPTSEDSPEALPTKSVVAPQAVAPDPQPKVKPRKAVEVAAPKPSQRRQEAEDRVEQMGRSPMKQIGPRIPREWDEWLEDYVYARRRTGLQKQDIIRDLVRGFIVGEIAREEGEA